MRPSALTPVASIIRSPAPESASWPRCIMCQSLALPSTALYWHIGATAMRLASVRSRSAIGVKSWLGMGTLLRRPGTGSFGNLLSPTRIGNMPAAQPWRPKPGGSAMVSEADLYAPVKGFLEAQGYDVKGEVRGCDVVARRGAEPLVIVELKLRFNLALVLQGVERLALSDSVYLAVPRAVGRRETASPDDRTVRKLCRRLGLGLMTVNLAAPLGRAVEIVLDPLPYQPRKNQRRAALLLGEHARRVGDHNRGGVRGVKIVTAYRQEALRCAQLLGGGPMAVKAMRATGLVPKVGPILQSDMYGWFRRRERGVYELTESGRQALLAYAHVLDLPADAAPAVIAAAE
jgi:hypothetical protein